MIGVVGPTGIALKQQGKFTYGALVNHLWTYSGSNGRDPVNSSFIQPFFSYLRGGGWSYSINTESTYDWTGNQWPIPINLTANKMIKIGNAQTQWQLGGRYYIETPDDGPEWGLRFAVIFLIL